MKPIRWCIVLPPVGAARTVACHTADAFSTLLDADSCKVIDSKAYFQLYESKCGSSDETYFVDLFNQSCAVACLDFEASHILVCALAPVTRFTLHLLRKYSIMTSHWFYEDYQRATYWQSVLSGYHHFFAIQHGDLEDACVNQCAGYHFLPTATGCGNYPYQENDRPYDVVFIGIPSAHRISVLEHIIRASLRLAIAGAHWDTYQGILEPYIVHPRWIDEVTAFQLMQQSITGINISYDNPVGRNDVHVSPRIFDLAAAGCFIVSEDTPLLYETVSGIICRTFITVDDAVQTIKTCCVLHQTDRSECMRNRATTLMRHQYVHRVHTLLQVTGCTG